MTPTAEEAIRILALAEARKEAKELARQAGLRPGTLDPQELTRQAKAILGPHHMAIAADKWARICEAQSKT